MFIRIIKYGITHYAPVCLYAGTDKVQNRVSTPPATEHAEAVLARGAQFRGNHVREAEVGERRLEKKINSMM
jgi:hypothetical protein